MQLKVAFLWSSYLNNRSSISEYSLWQFALQLNWRIIIVTTITIIVYGKIVSLPLCDELDGCCPSEICTSREPFKFCWDLPVLLGCLDVRSLPTVALVPEKQMVTFIPKITELYLSVRFVKTGQTWFQNILKLQPRISSCRLIYKPEFTWLTISLVSGT